jgi:uncharacterized protein (TIGR03067 family)
MMQGLLLAGVAFGLGAPGAKEPPKKDAPPSIIGTWEVEKMVLGGREGPARPIRFTFSEDGKLAVKRRPAEAATDCTYKTDDKKDPRELDWALEDKKEQTLKAIFKVEKDTLTMCFEDGFDSERPAKFASVAGTKLMIWTLKRVEKGKE